MIERIIERLGQFGIEVKISDRRLIIAEYENALSFIRSSCNIDEIPNDLENVIIERTCGNFLFVLKNFRGLDGADYEAFVKEIAEGDVKVVFDEDSVLSEEQKIDKVIDFLMGYGEEIILSKRCICW